MNITLRFDNTLPTHFDPKGELAPGVCAHYCERFVKELASIIEGKYPEAEVYIITEYALKRPYYGHSAVIKGRQNVEIEADLKALHNDLLEDTKSWAIF